MCFRAWLFCLWEFENQETRKIARFPNQSDPFPGFLVSQLILMSAQNSSTGDYVMPNSRRIYMPGELHPEIRVPFREIFQAPTRSLNGKLEPNEPIRVYDTSGPWGDSEVQLPRRARPAADAHRLDPVTRRRGRSTPAESLGRRTMAICRRRTLSMREEKVQRPRSANDASKRWSAAPQALSLHGTGSVDSTTQPLTTQLSRANLCARNPTQ